LIGFSQKEKPKDTTYALVGKIGDFQLLYKAVSSPGDVTPNQITALLAWIQKVQALPPKEEKPKN